MSANILHIEAEKEAGYSKWNDAQTKLLISLYPGFKKRLENRHIGSAKKMWEQMAKIMEEHGYCFTPAQVESKWKVLNRAATTSNNNHRARKRRPFPYQRELSRALGREDQGLMMEDNSNLQEIEEDTSASDDDVMQQVVQRISLARAPKEILKLAQLQNVPSVVAVYNFSDVPTSKHLHSKGRGRGLQKTSSSIQQRTSRVQSDVREESESECGVQLREDGTVRFSQPMVGNRRVAKTLTRELAALRAEYDERQFVKQKAAELREKNRQIRHRERIGMLRKLLEQLVEEDREEVA